MGHERGKACTAGVMGWGLSGHHDPELALHHVIEQVRTQIGPGDATFAAAFLSERLVPSTRSVARKLAAALGTEALIGGATRSVIGGRSTLHERTGLAVLAARLPDVSARAFALEPAELPDEQAKLETTVAERASTDDCRACFVLADPTTLATSQPMEAISRIVPEGRIVGGLTAWKRGEHAPLIAGPRALPGGLVGLSLGGAIRVDALVAQGARQVGSPLVVTKAHRNMIYQLGGRPAIEVLREVAQGFDVHDRRLLGPGLYLGVAVDEYRDRFGRGDFAVRKILGGDEPSGAIAIDAEIRAGRTVQVHLLDPELARGDLALLLDAQKLYDRPLGGLLFADTHRGPPLFGDEWSDALAVARAFDHTQTGTDAAKVGYEIAEQAGPIPLIGCFVDSAIGPAGGRARAHGLAACLALFRAGDG